MLYPEGPGTVRKSVRKSANSKTESKNGARIKENKR
jgi:hypothetical protein